MNRVFRTLLLLFAMGPLALFANPRPNVILIMADDMGYGDPSYVSGSVLKADGSPHPDQGWIQTPNMDAMAASGLRFDRFYSASSVCSPTRASCLTGRNPVRVGVPRANDGFMGEEETPLSELLAAQGYATGHFGKWHLGTMTTLRSDANRGAVGNTEEYHAPWHFDYDVCFATESKVPTYHPYRKTANGSALPTAFVIDPVIGYKITDANFYGTHYWTTPADPATAAEGVVVPLDVVNNATDGDDSKLLTDQAIGFIQDSVAAAEPFFVVLWYHTPHKPIVDPDEVSGLNSSDAAKDSIEDLDAEIGRLRSELTTLGVRDNTMLWLTSDNGPEEDVDSPSETIPARSIRSGGLRDRKRSLYEGGIRVPSVLEWPAAIPSGTSTNFVASTSDYFPTVLDYLGLAVPDQKALDGISLRPLIEGSLNERPSSIGFLFDDRRAWIDQDFKLVDDGAGWELHDMTLADHQMEITPLATAADVASQPAEIQDVYTAMLAEYTAWKATVDDDTVYANDVTPAVTLSAAISETEGPFTVSISCDKAVTGLAAEDFAVSGGYAGSLAGSGTDYSVLITPSYADDIVIQLPQGAAFALDGNPSLPSNELAIDVPSAVEIESSQTTVPMLGGAFVTVDFDDLSPADGSNNVEKFPTTTLYLRGSGNINARKVRALVQFDLSGEQLDSVDSAILHLRGTSLNDFVPVSLQAVAAAADGSTSPSYDLATQGSVVDGGDVTAGLDGSMARDYSLDVTEMVNAWLAGSWTNHGIVIRLSDDTLNNGVGFELSGQDAPFLELSQIPLKIRRMQIIPQPGETGDLFQMVVQGVMGRSYNLERSADLSDPNSWSILEVVEPVSNVFSVDSPMESLPSAFYRISTTSP